MTTSFQQGDVQLFQSLDDGNIIVDSGIVAMSGGLATSAYLSLFGGNVDDDGSSDSNKQYWGNISEPDRVNHYRSETQNILLAIPLTTGNLLRVENAVRRDLAWFITERVANLVEVSVSISQRNTIQIDVRIEAFGEESEFRFVENWKRDIDSFLPELPIQTLNLTHGNFLLEDGGFLLLEDGVSNLETEAH